MMVEPISDEERDSFTRKLEIGFVVFVGLSAGLITLQADAGLDAFLGATAFGVVVGAVLVRIAFP